MRNSTQQQLLNTLSSLTGVSVPTSLQDASNSAIQQWMLEQLEQLKTKQDQQFVPRQFLDSMHEGVVVTDLDERIRFVNQQFCQMVGYTADEIIGKEAGNALQFSDSDIQLFHQKTADRKQGISDTYELPIRRKDGSIISFWVSGNPMYNTESELIGSVGVFTNITDLKNLEVQRLESERQFRYLFERSPDPIFVEDFEGNVLDVNPAACRLHDMKHEDLVGINIFELFSDEDRESMRKQFFKFTTGELEQLDSVSPQSDGSSLPVNLSVSRIEYKGIPALLLIVRDISDHKRMEAALKRSEARYRTLFEGSHGLMCTHDKYGVIQSINPAGSELLGYEQNVLIGMSIQDLLAEDVKEQFQPYLHQIQEEKISVGIMKIRTSSGELRYWAYRNVWYEEEGVDPCAIGSGVDITDRYMMEVELESANEIAELNIQRLHRTLTELEKANIEVERSIKVKEEFIANMSHEIRTPLNAIIGFTDLLKETPLKDDQREYLESIHFSGEQLLVTLNEILDFSKLEAGKLNIEQTVFDVRRIIEEEYKLFEPKAWANNLEYCYDYDDDEIPERVIGDPHRLSQILNNLIGNAIKFTTEGSVSIGLEILKKTKQQIRLQFSVQDTGVGIPEEQKENIFESFVQANHSVTRKFGGTGLGLAIVKRLVDLQHGELEVISTPGEGSTFRVTITYDIYQGQLHQESVTPDDERERLPELNILVAEDNLLNQQLTIKVLESEGHKVTVVGDGVKAIEAIEQQQFDLIFMDIQMPLMGGVEATRIIRTDLNSNIPIVALTAHSFKNERDKYQTAGMNAHLSKPFRKKQMIEVLEQVILGKTITSTLNEEQLFDLSSLIELADDDIEFVQRLITLFIEQSPVNLSQLRLHADQRELEAVRTLAHKMRTSYNSIGFVKGGNLLREIEELSTEQANPAQFITALDALDALTAEACIGLRKELSKSIYT